MIDPTKKIKSLLLLCLLFSVDLLFSQVQHDIKFTTIDNTNGLPSNIISSIVTDDLGFLWIGTSDGLCRYEGQNIVKTYRANDPKIIGGLENSNIRSLFLDSKKNLWIGTRLGGLTRFHQPSGTWKTFRNKKGDPQSISNDEILVITEDKKGRILVGTEDGLNIFHPATETFISFKSDKKDPNGIIGKAVLSVFVDDQESVWIGTWGGGVNLMLLPENGDLTKARFRQFYPNDQPGAKNIWKIYQDRQDRYWIGSRGAGLFAMSIPKDSNIPQTSKDWQPEFHQYKYDINNPEISNDHIEDIYQDVGGNLWIGTVDGLNCVWSKDLSQAFKNKKGSQKVDLFFNRYNHHPQDRSSIINNNVNAIFEDTQGLLWFGTYSGVSKYNWFTNQFEVHKIADDISKTPNTQNLYIDQEGVVWFGYGENGIIKYDYKKNEKTSLDLKNENLKDNFVFTLFSPDHRNLYIGTQKGVIVLDLKTNQSKMYPLPPNIDPEIGFLSIRSLFRDNQNRIWLGTLTGLYVIDEETGVYTQYNHDFEDPYSISDNSINQVYQDSKGNIWISTFNGLNKLIDYTSDNLRFQSFKHDTNNPEESIPSNRITALIEINEIIYIGSNTGISGYDLKQDIFINYSKNNYKKSIQSIEKTIDGNIWASTTEGILFFNPKTKEFNQYDKKDGIGDGIFQAGSSYHDHKGYLYFGTRQGIIRFHPVNLINNEAPPAVYVTNVRKLSPEGEIQSNGIYANELVMNHDEYYLSLDYVALNYNRPEKNKYAFKLEGFEEKWNYPEGKPSAIYTNLAHGTYTFRIKAANNDGVWNETGTSLKIIKRPAFWETWLFKIIGLFLAFVLLNFSVKKYTKGIKERNKILQKFNKDLNQEITRRKKVEMELQEREQHMESLVKLRTKELEIKNQEVKNLLKDISERNEHLEVEIAKRTKNLRASNADLQRSNKDLEQFAYIASHDLQEPLRVVGSFISLLRRRYKEHFDEEAFQYIDFAVDGVQRMSLQIKNVLLFSQVSQKEIKCNLTNINEVIQTKLHDLSKKIEEKNVVFKIENMPEIMCEKMQIEMVFFNLISNAIKFNKNQTPTITISNQTTEEDGFWHFSVKDNGIGIEKQYQKKIFEIFRRLNNKSEFEGTGIGLALCERIIHRHNGKIWLESFKGQGTTFHFTISKELTSTKKQDDKKLSNEVSN